MIDKLGSLKTAQRSLLQTCEDDNLSLQRSIIKIPFLKKQKKAISYKNHSQQTIEPTLLSSSKNDKQQMLNRLKAKQKEVNQVVTIISRSFSNKKKHSTRNKTHETHQINYIKILPQPKNKKKVQRNQYLFIPAQLSAHPNKLISLPTIIQASAKQIKAIEKRRQPNENKQEARRQKKYFKNRLIKKGYEFETIENRSPYQSTFQSSTKKKSLFENFDNHYVLDKVIIVEPFNVKKNSPSQKLIRGQGNNFQETKRSSKGIPLGIKSKRSKTVNFISEFD